MTMLKGFHNFHRAVISKKDEKYILFIYTSGSIEQYDLVNKSLTSHKFLHIF